ncbi:MAG: hypothetical protein H6818_02115 [Phycisphaerales bacterium]|nr:hypothetical protein [Phycisphaerales bacterium]
MEAPNNERSHDVANRNKRLAQAPSLWTIVPAVGITLYALNDASVPGNQWTADFLYDIPALFAGLFFLIDYLRRVMACWDGAVRRAADQDKRPQRRSWRWAVLPLCCLMIVSIKFQNWPLYARFALSRSAMNAMQSKIEEGGAIPTHTVRVGLYRVWIRQVYGQTVYFTGGGHPSSGRGCGFLQGEYESPVLRTLDPVMDDWYVAYGYPYENRDVYPTTRTSGARTAGE